MATFSTFQNLYHQRVWDLARDFDLEWDGTTDDTGALQVAIDYVAGKGGGAFFCPDGVCLLSSPSTTVNGCLAQIHLPTRVLGTQAGLSMAFFGANSPSCIGADFGGGFGGGFASPTDGPVFKSTATTGAVFGVRAAVGGAYDFSILRLRMENLFVRTYDNPQIHGLDLRYLGDEPYLKYVVVDTDQYNFDSATQPSHNTYGIALPIVSNSGGGIVHHCRVSGYHVGVLLGEHADLTACSITTCNYAIEVGSQVHPMLIHQFIENHCPNGILCSAGAGFNPVLTILQWRSEYIHPSTGSPVWQRRQKDIVDSNNRLYGGAVHVVPVLQGNGRTTNWSVTGATNFTKTVVGP